MVVILLPVHGRQRGRRCSDTGTSTREDEAPELLTRKPCTYSDSISHRASGTCVQLGHSRRPVHQPATNIQLRLRRNTFHDLARTVSVITWHCSLFATLVHPAVALQPNSRHLVLVQWSHPVRRCNFIQAPGAQATHT